VAATNSREFSRQGRYRRFRVRVRVESPGV